MRVRQGWCLLASLAALTACAWKDEAPAAPIPAVCERQVYDDPVVKDLILKGAGSENFRLENTERLKYAKIDASRRCLQQKGLLPPGGGVQRPNVSG